MLNGENEIQIMSTARDEKLRKSTDQRATMQLIINDWLSSQQFASKTIIELGPGQYEFLDFVREAGARTIGCDHDEAVCKLGKARGHTVFNTDFRRIETLPSIPFDGIFCRGSFNPYWFQRAPDKLNLFFDYLQSNLAKDGWLLFFPWSKPIIRESSESKFRIDEIVHYRLTSMRAIASYVTPALSSRYKNFYQVPTESVWYRL